MSRKKQPEHIDTLAYEKKASEAGYKVIAGIDEAGRGPLAGPVVAAAVVLQGAVFEARVDDSKKLSPSRREKAFLEIFDKCDVGIGTVDVDDIDRLNIFNATKKAMKLAVEELSVPPDYLLVDGNMKMDLPYVHLCLIKGESRSLSIACASIIAKVFRDKIMVEKDRIYPEYGFAGHKGYGTKKHIEAIRMHGMSPIHRKSFGPFGGKDNI